MKHNFILLSILLIANKGFSQQPATNNLPGGAASGVSSQQYWSRAGNNNSNGTNNIFGTLWNSPVYTQTNSLQRMVLMGSNPPGSISGALGLGLNLISPLSKLHVQDFGVNPISDANGRMFRSDGANTVENYWSMYTGASSTSILERFRIATYASSDNAYLGTVQNGWLNFRTNNTNRMKLNADYTAVNQYNVNGYVFGTGINNINTSGYLLLGANANSITSPTLDLYTNKGAFSMLHLNGATSSNSFQEYGFRPWMKTGITFTGNRDLSYFG